MQAIHVVIGKEVVGFDELSFVDEELFKLVISVLRSREQLVVNRFLVVDLGVERQDTLIAGRGIV